MKYTKMYNCEHSDFVQMAPTTNLAKLFVVGLISCAFIMVPFKLKELYKLSYGRNSLHQCYGENNSNKHVVLLAPQQITSDEIHCFASELLFRKENPLHCVIMANADLCGELARSLKEKSYFKYVHSKCDNDRFDWCLALYRWCQAQYTMTMI